MATSILGLVLDSSDLIAAERKKQSVKGLIESLLSKLALERQGGQRDHWTKEDRGVRTGSRLVGPAVLEE